ncbi:MAG: c-type cytochrome [Bacteroidota bacterium]
MINNSWFKSLLVFLSIISLTSSLLAQAEADLENLNLDEGKTLFRNYCATCHATDMKSDLTGPALGGAEERWADYPPEDLYRWIRQSQAMVNEGHPRATELWAEWGPTVMNNFLQLTDQNIADILGYIDGVYTEVYPPRVAGAPAPGVVTAEKPDNTLLFVALAVILGILAVILARIVSNLNYMIQVREGEDARRRSLVEILTSKGVIAFVVFALVVVGGYTTVNNAIMLGRQQGYAPEQPIKFSHATHAGLNQIDCQYCHDGARRSKHSVIPAANTCMNCHKAIKVGSQYGTAEITKIYASIGYDPNTDTYLENYDAMSQSEIEKIYKKWIDDTYVKDNQTAPEDNYSQNQWDDIVASLTNENKTKVQGPIEWIRIHNLPDHAYFNHAQHVTVGKVECQTCHGPVEEMEVVQQYSPLSMGWCVNCHRQTEVQFANNDYYKAYEKYHEEIANGSRTKVTVEDVGGLECQKCHY